MRVEVFSPTAVRLWRGCLWWKKYREAILYTGKDFANPTWIWVDTEQRCVGIQEEIDEAVSDWHWKQPAKPASLPNAIVVSPRTDVTKKKVGF